MDGLPSKIRVKIAEGSRLYREFVDSYEFSTCPRKCYAAWFLLRCFTIQYQENSIFLYKDLGFPLSVNSIEEVKAIIKNFSDFTAPLSNKIFIKNHDFINVGINILPILSDAVEQYCTKKYELKCLHEIKEEDHEWMLNTYSNCCIKNDIYSYSLNELSFNSARMYIQLHIDTRKSVSDIAMNIYIKAFKASFAQKKCRAKKKALVPLHSHMEPEIGGLYLINKRKCMG